MKSETIIVRINKKMLDSGSASIYLENARNLGIPNSLAIPMILNAAVEKDPLGIGAPPTREELAKREAAEKAKAEAAQKEARIQRIREIKLEVFKSGEANPLPGETHEEGETRIKAIIKARLAAEGISEE